MLFIYVLNCADVHSYSGEAMHVCVDVHVLEDVCSVLVNKVYAHRHSADAIHAHMHVLCFHTNMLTVILERCVDNACMCVCLD